ncbi:MAG: glycerol-3-phosphate acyltransferase [Bacteroidia bacterium]|nr:glycerol-3-phosphate acyltransferase [Bacteroidia bacterium]
MQSLLIYSVISTCAFIVGSFPTAYLLVRRHSGKDLRHEGSGNIGTLNAFEVSRSKRVGVLVLFIDVLKGFGATAIAGSVAADGYTASAIAMLAVVAGHNYSPWIGWKGGRGLAPAAGAAIAFNPLLLGLWILYWLLVFAKTRNVHIGNIAASVMTPATVLFTLDLFAGGMMHSPADTWWLLPPVLLLFALILIRHIEPLRTLLRTGKASSYTTTQSGQE